MQSIIELPWPALALPRYRVGSVDRWSVRKTPQISRSVGYFLPHASQPAGWCLKRDGQTWMSLTAMEIESHMPHVAAARGHVVIAGLGMGMALYNIAAKEEVTRVTVLEQDPATVAILDKCSDWKKWPGRDKVEVVIGDALEYRTTEHVDFLYADIWQKRARTRRWR